MPSLVWVLKFPRFQRHKISITLLLFPQCLELSADESLRLICKVKQKFSETQHFDDIFSEKLIVPANAIQNKLTQSHSTFCENTMV